MSQTLQAPVDSGRRAAIRDFVLPATPEPDTEHLFADPPVLHVQTPAEAHEYKKCSGSSDGTQTYDTTAT